ncbi:E3 ubiquitin-protein ligase BRE1A-like isoform X3 [Mya arenaria]|uniref:E3 ubiquitin-protein ligase BRE1A-like isoform X3 n=1 Tax=Mya arenaria TaxID=6604 RepID=UPI0022E110D8|nr:E3 ubiquitin-protein ligase BRE1A-like isoform X3 [Mya arenaria]XP_052790629.1 E3 ubiquitin-protein ligase BRE1A-like isoform X3 [Mya arenaria]XP_052790636.1 E3 ubiquitin-protein ligase BRE1A-like isoform X3 [Mya arenaria]
MVLSDMPFEKSRLIHSRYSTMRRPDSAPAPMEEDKRDKISKEYAAFLKEQERKVGPEGFLDSTRYSHTFHVKKEREKLKTQGETSKPTVVRLSTQIDGDKKEHDKRIKIIETSIQQLKDHMWQHKQEEREMKRTEGDIIKNQRAVKHMLRDYENVINKKRMAEEVKLNKGLEKYTVLRKEYTHQAHDNTKARTHQNIAFEHAMRDHGRKTEMTKSDLARTYKSKMSEMELRQIELTRINQEFETKMRQKEQEKHRLKQELAELAIALNMEAQKGRVQSFEANREKKRETTNKIVQDLTTKQDLENKLAKSDGDNKQAEMTKRKLAADLALTKAHIAIKQRDDQRHLKSTLIRLDDNSNVQRDLNEAAFHAEMDLRSKQMQQNIEVHTSRRALLMKKTMKQKKVTDEAKQKVWEERFRKRASEKARLEHEDSLKFFQKMVTKGEEQEQHLYGKVRNAEYSRQKQDQAVRRLQQQLAEVKRRNAAIVKQTLAERNQEEVELEQALIREKAELDKMHVEREETYYTLQSHRQGLKTDKLNLVGFEKQHSRNVGIGNTTDTLEAYA